MNTKLFLLLATVVVAQSTWTCSDYHDPKQNQTTGRPVPTDFFYGQFPHSGNTK